ncbi:MAG TPA: hypothetical protein VFJ98_05935 [Mycobacteriales bacterium]|nr:hypothetical protein [Mycobacteriales bacterium]
MKRPHAALAALAVLAPIVIAVAPAGAALKALPNTACTVFPADNWWHADVSRLPVHPRSKAWLSHMSPTAKLHPDFGPSYGAQSVPYGIPYTVVTNAHPTHRVSFAYADESDDVRYPIGTDSKIEGGSDADGDRHVLIVNKDTCRLYELFDVHHTSKGWTAGSGAVWSLKSDRLRPSGWTSADAAGLPILPGLLRWDEVKAGHVDHAIRFTTNITDRRYLWPARHQAGSVSNHNYPPMGARFRLKASFPISSYRKDTQVVLRAMKHYGLVLADNGSPWYFQGAQSGSWPSGLLDQLKKIPASAFVAVDTSSLRIRWSSAATK